MNHIKKPDDDGLIHIQRLSPDQFDVVLGSHPSKQKAFKPGKTGSFGRTLLVLTALGIGAYALIPHAHTSTPVASSVPQPSEVVRSEPVEAAIAPVATPAPASKTVVTAPEVVVIDRTPEQNSAPEPTTDTLPAKPAPGMVSAQYMAGFKHDLAHSTPQRRVNFEVDTVTIREWDGRDRYQARWRVFKNHVEGDSVCFNFPATSVEHRECRKAAQVYFKEQCREWTKRADNDGEELSKQRQTRYCEAVGSFNPAG